MPAQLLQEDRHIWKHRVKVLPSGEGSPWPIGVVPSEALHPTASRLDQLRIRPRPFAGPAHCVGRQSTLEQVGPQSARRLVHDVRVRVRQPRNHRSASEIHNARCCASTCCNLGCATAPHNCLVATHGLNAAPGHTERRGVGLRGRHRVDAAVPQDECLVGGHNARDHPARCEDGGAQKGPQTGPSRPARHGRFRHEVLGMRLASEAFKGEA
mmetsp:Transcript_62539/g.179386  ORF Transcript_62539/g.179386 Transcript_62539/m.179386 type:complete len:212 (+) Transcript_62539:1531-2166(+)